MTDKVSVSVSANTALNVNQMSDMTTNVQVGLAPGLDVNPNFDLNFLSQQSHTSDLDEHTLDKLVTDVVPTATARATKWGLNKWNAWLTRRNNLHCDFYTIDANDLNVLLRKFYAELRPEKKHIQNDLTPSSLSGIRAALHRTITSPPYNRSMNIISGTEFTTANNMFTAKCKQYVKNGNPKPQHKPPISDSDMKLLGQYFQRWQTDPVILQETVWFMLCFHFGRRGREGWAQMTIDSLVVAEETVGENQIKYVKENKTEQTKNHQGGARQKEQDYSSRNMYGHGVEVFEFYLHKLDKKCQRLFQKANKNLHQTSDSTWFAPQPLGKTSLSNMMQSISRKSSLSKVYTCHSVRASTITTLFQAGASAQMIMQVTKHKNESSLNHYVSGLSSDQNRWCNSILQNALGSSNDQQVFLNFNLAECLI